MRQSDPTKERSTTALVEVQAERLKQLLDIEAERDALREALQRLVADLETNSEAGAPDYAFKALERHP